MEFHNQLNTTEETVMRRLLVSILKSVILLSLLEDVTDLLCSLLQPQSSGGILHDGSLLRSCWGTKTLLQRPLTSGCTFP